MYVVVHRCLRVDLYSCSDIGPAIDLSHRRSRHINAPVCTRILTHERVAVPVISALAKVRTPGSVMEEIATLCPFHSIVCCRGWIMERRSDRPWRDEGVRAIF